MCNCRTAQSLDAESARRGRNNWHVQKLTVFIWGRGRSSPTFQWQRLALIHYGVFTEVQQREKERDKNTPEKVLRMMHILHGTNKAKWDKDKEEFSESYFKIQMPVVLTKPSLKWGSMTSDGLGSICVFDSSKLLALPEKRSGEEFNRVWVLSLFLQPF